MKLRQEEYAGAAIASRAKMKVAAADVNFAKLMAQVEKLKNDPRQWKLDNPYVKAAARQLMKAGVSTSLGFNFYDLRGPAYFIFPLLTPFIQMIGKEGKINAGTGTAAHWKATRNPNSTYAYSGAAEGKRVATATPNEVDYLATYKELGQEGGETFTAQYAGEGYTDNLADEHFRNLARLRLQEEMMTLWGNGGNGTGMNGFALGQTPNVTSTLATGTGALGTSANVCVACVAITAMGMNPGGQAGYAVPPTVAGGLTTQYTRNNADGSTDTIHGGIAAISNVAANVTTNASAQLVNVSVPAVTGAVAYAWFWGVNVTANAASVTLGAITSYPHYQITDVASGTQKGDATNLNVDNSYNTLDFDGLGTYMFTNGRVVDMDNGSFTPQGNGQVAEIEADLQFLWNNYQAQPDAIWCSADTRQALEQAIIYSSTGNNSYIFQYNRDTQGGILGGFTVTAYKSKYSINLEGGAAIPIRIHPMIPDGVLFYDIDTNPYPHSRIPAVRKFLLQRDYYSIEWPIVSRQWTFGTYVHEVLAHYMPWITCIRTGVGPFVAPCFIAAVVFAEDFFTGPRVTLVRRWLVSEWEQRNVFTRAIMHAYRVYGQRAAKVVERSRVLKFAFRKLFDRVLAKAEEKYNG